MADPSRVDDDLFYRPDSATRSAHRPASYTADEFFPHAVSTAPTAQTFLLRTARDPIRLGAMLALIGFWTVFVNQAMVLIQIVIGAPVFEEFFKAGLALLIIGLLRIRPAVARVVVGLGIGAGFGVLEHTITYATEPDILYQIRIAFHAGSTGLSMVVFTLLEPLRDVRVRWGLTLPSTIVHACNNTTAVVLGVVAAITSGEAVDEVGLQAMAAYTASLYALALVLIVTRRFWWRLVERRFPGPTAGFTPEVPPSSAVEAYPSEPPGATGEASSPRDRRQDPPGPW